MLYLMEVNNSLLYERVTSSGKYKFSQSRSYPALVYKDDITYQIFMSGYYYGLLRK